MPANDTTMATYIEDIARHEGQTVTLRGWLHNRRSSGKIHFLTVRDGTGFIQAVMSKAAVGDETFVKADHLGQESSIVVTGTVRADKRAPGGYELDVSGVRGRHARRTTIRSRRRSTASTTCSTGGTCGFARPGSRRFCASGTRSSTRAATSSTAAASSWPTRRSSRPSACEGTTTLFPVQYFEDTTAYLTQSGQLYNEANAMALGRVYAFGPTFRAEKSKTRRHLTEFWMVEPEMAYATLDDTMDLAESLVVSVVSRVLEKRRPELAAIERDTTKLERVQAPFPRITYDEAVARLKAKGQPIEWGGDFGGTDETVLSEEFDRPVCVHRYPSQVKAFYMKPDPERPEVALGVDVHRARRLRRDHRRRPAAGRLRAAAAAHPRAQAAAGGVRLVSGPAPLRLGAAQRLRHGHRARRLLDLRPGPRARDDSVSADVVSAVSVIAAHGSRLRQAARWLAAARNWLIAWSP